GAVRTEIEGRIEDRLLPNPHAVLHHRVDRAAHGAVRADRALGFRLARRRLVLGVGLADHTKRKLAREPPGPSAEPRTLQKRPPIQRRGLTPRAATETWMSCRGAVVRAIIDFGEQHDPFLLLENLGWRLHRDRPAHPSAARSWRSGSTDARGR